MTRKTILLVDDDGVLRDVMKDALERDYTVLEASKYSEAELQLTKSVDLALVDYVLSDCDGFEILSMITEMKPRLPVIFITAYSTEGTVIRALRAGVTDYIKKPFSFGFLKGRIFRALGGTMSSEETECVDNREKSLMDGMALYVEEHYMEDLRLDALARKAGMNKYRFSRAFKERFGQGFKSYLNNVRVKKAAELLKTPDLNITEITHSVGFGTVVSFERVFRQIYASSPTEYRRYLRMWSDDSSETFTLSSEPDPTCVSLWVSAGLPGGVREKLPSKSLWLQD